MMKAIELVLVAAARAYVAVFAVALMLAIAVLAGAPASDAALDMIGPSVFLGVAGLVLLFPLATVDVSEL